MKSPKRAFEVYGLGAFAAAAVGVSILDFIGALDEVGWLQDRVPTLTLLLVATVASYLIFERRNNLDTLRDNQQEGEQRLLGNIDASKTEVLTAIDREISRAISASQGAGVSSFDGRAETTKYLLRSIKAARQTIDVTHFTPSAPPWKTPEEQAYYDAYSEIVKSRNVRVRRILLVNSPEQLRWAEDLVAEYQGHRYYVGCYPKESFATPHVTLVIIDGAEVWLTAGERSPALNPISLSVRHPKFAEAFEEHFNALWRSSLRLNEGSFRPELVQQLRDAF